MQQQPPTSGVPLELAGLDLAPFLREVANPGSLIQEAHRLSGGASKESWLLRVAGGTDSSPGREYVLRRASPETASKLAGASLPVEVEFEIMRAASEAGVRVPRPIHLRSDPNGSSFFVMEFIDGETLAPRILGREGFAEARGKLIGQMAHNLAAIHRIPPGAVPSLGSPPDDPAGHVLSQFEDIYRRVSRAPSPVFELAFRHLRSTKPTPEAPSVIHGDFRLGNFIVGPEGLRAVLDWELAHLGDPAEDLAWTAVRAWRFGRDDLPVAGLASREDLLTSYAAAGGPEVDPQRLRWWEAFGNLRWGVITLIQAAPFINGQTRDIEKAAIGRRTTEVEAELLNLI